MPQPEALAEATKIIRKKTGNFLEDFQPGQIFRHKGGKTITEGLFTTFTEFAMTTHPFAKNERYAKAYGFEGGANVRTEIAGALEPLGVVGARNAPAGISTARAEGSKSGREHTAAHAHVSTSTRRLRTARGANRRRA